MSKPDPATPPPAGEKAPASQVTTSDSTETHAADGPSKEALEAASAINAVISTRQKFAGRGRHGAARLLTLEEIAAIIDPEFAKLRAERDTLAQRLSEAEKLAHSSVGEASRQVHVSDNLNRDLMEQLHAAQTYIADLKKAFDDSEKRTERYSARIAELEKEVEGFKANNRYHRGHTHGYDEATADFKTRIAELEAQLSAKKDLGNDIGAEVMAENKRYWAEWAANRVRQDGEPRASEVRGLYVILESQIQIQEHVREHLRQIVELANVNPATRSILRSIGNALNNSIQFARETLKSSQQQGADKLSDVVKEPPNPPPSDQQGPSAEEIVIRRSTLRYAVDYSCTCGGNPPESPKACPACMVWHRLIASLGAAMKERTP